jgi:hypothetical protein
VKAKVLGQEAEPRARRDRAESGAEHRRLAGAGLDQAEQHLERGGLARAVGTQETEDLSRPHGQGEIGDGELVPEALAQPAGLDYGLGHPTLRGAGQLLACGCPARREA